MITTNIYNSYLTDYFNCRYIHSSNSTPRLLSNEIRLITTSLCKLLAKYVPSKKVVMYMSVEIAHVVVSRSLQAPITSWSDT